MINKQNGLKVMTNDYAIQVKYAQLEGKKATDSYTLSIQSNLNVKDIFQTKHYQFLFLYLRNPIEKGITLLRRKIFGYN